jgi:uncharacterized protein (DUF1015 family)
MATVRPFAAVRPRPDRAADVASVPYDVVDAREARELAQGNPSSFLHVVRAEIDLPDGVDPHADEVYAQAARAYRELRDEGTLIQEETPGLYLYRLEVDGHSQTAVVGCCSVDEYEADVVKKHEGTRPDKENDRVRHILETGIQAGPVFMTYRGQQAIDDAVRDIRESTEPCYDFTAADGVRHTVWRAPDARPLVAAFGEVPSLYVADGHHRSASAARARAARRDANAAHTGDEEYNVFLAALFPADQVRILAYNRVAHDLGGSGPGEFLERLRESFQVTAAAAPAPDRPGTFSMYLDGSWYALAPRPGVVQTDDPVEALDAAVLQRVVLGPLLGIDDPRLSDRIDFVGGIRGTGELERRVDRRGAGVAFSLFPVSLDQLMAVADAGRFLPPKSTWFEPKLRSGLLVHEI